MSTDNPGYRVFRITDDEHNLWAIPRPHMLGLRLVPKLGQQEARIELRFSTGTATVTGRALDGFWTALIDGKESGISKDRVEHWKGVANAITTDFALGAEEGDQP